MENLKRFIGKYKDYSLKDSLTYNSYRTGQRTETRDWDSVSITEILGLIEDSNMEMVKRFHSDKLKKACNYGTSQHKAIEDFINNKIQGDTEVFKNFRLFTIKHGVTDMRSELDYKTIYKDLPTVTGAIDCVASIDAYRTIIDWKTSKNKRSFKSVKYNLQLAGYRWLSGIRRSSVCYLNKSGYEYIESKDNEYWDEIWLELLEYSNELYKKGNFINLYKGNETNN